ncbi:sensor histidine kinase [Spirosoma endophyticum]|uniref:histidine kinase n=1 Tax=Spirosoma endophyticum TaxID=662367 RepID=A0A1I2CCE1_9BACT|nr:HAMP domain-containing sensor histidine kinase [Spirosoma endophyticum]SFE65991.1 Signal transduction histidine kinase [Spirosoma endophyticum]
MKLVQKTTRYIFLALLPIALGGVFLLDYFIHQTISDEIDELLHREYEQVKLKLRQHPPEATTLRNWDHNLQITIATTPGSLSSPILADSTFVDPLDNELVRVRKLLATYSVKQHHYVITLHQPYLEFDEIAHILSMGIIICFLALVSFLLLFEAAIFQRIWRPFYAIIDQLKMYRIDQSESVTFPVSDVDEFALLSQSLEKMIRRAGYQYRQQKQFADNASHEMQTPLSILSFELDLLQQSSQLTEADLHRIQRSQHTIKRLSSMNQSLLLLTKIDNQQFIQNESINISEITNQLIENYADYAAHKGMILNRIIKDGPYRPMNRQLAFVLFSNLIKNAIRHGSPNTSILIQVTSHSFIITNQGDPLPFPEEEIFQRFVRNQALPQSTGLGLALVKEIADQYGMSVYYAYASSIRRHIVEVKFENESEPKK